MPDPWEDYLRSGGFWNPEAPHMDESGVYRPPDGGWWPQGTAPQTTSAPSPAMWDGVAIGSDDYWRKVEDQLRAAGGPMYDPSDLEGVKRNASNTHGEGLAGAGAALQNQFDIYRQRDPTNSYGLRAGEPVGAGGGGSQRSGLPGMQFDDAYSNLLEQIGRSQLGEVRSNPGLDALMQFLTKQFTDLSTNPGYNADEMALLRTQAFEPIEANRAASKQRATERAAARGFAPSSGLMELDLRDVERAADQARTVAGRDLAIAGLDRRDRDLSRALDLGQLLGLTIPRSQRGEEVALGNMLYQMPRTAMNDALGVISGTPSSSDAFTQALQLLQNQQNQQYRSDQQNAALYGAIGDWIARAFGR